MMCKRLTLITLLVLTGLGATAQAKIKWTGNGENSFWDNGDNWNKGGRIPLPDEDAQIDIDGTMCIIDEINVGDKAAVARQLNLMHRGDEGAEMTLTIDGGVLNLGGRLLIGSGTSSKAGASATLIVESGQVFVPQIQLGKYVDNVSIVLNGGRIDCSGILEIGVNVYAGSTRTLTLNGGVLKAVSTTGSSQGAIVLNGGVLELGTLNLNDLVSLDVREGAVLLTGHGDQTDAVRAYAQAGYITVFGEHATRGGLVVTYDPDLDQTSVTGDASQMELTKAWAPAPVGGGVPVALEALVWKPGNDTAPTQGHDVYFGPEADTVANATVDNPMGVYTGRQDANSFAPEDLILAQTYYYRVDQIDAATGEIYPGEVWSFTVQNNVMIDNFNDYANWEAVLEVWEETGSAWNTISGDFSSGGNSMRVTLNHPNQTDDQKGTHGALILRRDMDFTVQGARALAFDFASDPNQGFVRDIYIELSDGVTAARVTIDDPVIVRNRAWGPVDIDLARFVGVDLAQIKSLAVGVNVLSSVDQAVSVYFDDIRLLPRRCVPERTLPSDLNGDCVVDDADLAMLLDSWLEGTVLVTAAQPPEPNNWFPLDELDPWYLAFMDEMDDRDDPNYPLVVTEPSLNVTVDLFGGFDGAGAAVFPGDDDPDVRGEGESHINVNKAGIDSLGGSELTVSLWVNGNPELQPFDDVVFDAGEAGSQIRFECPDSQGRVVFTHGMQPRDVVTWDEAEFADWAGEWNHYALVKDATQGVQQIFHNGLLVAENAGAFQSSLFLDDMRIGATNQPVPQRPYHGKLDDLRFYGSALPQAAILSLAGVDTLEQAPVTPADINEDGSVDQADRDLLDADMGRTQLWPSDQGE
ncbi:MAG: LamG domain-containing protein [Planctomycetes bacterium]|nr:LamG domain-containing protein [Planctomycetota bacterium]